MKPNADTHFPLSLVADITCLDPNRPQLVIEKACKTVRLLSYPILNGVSKSKVVHDVLERGKNIGKALNDVVVRHHQAFTCRPRDPHVSFVSPSPLEYQFSCNGTPPRVSHASRRNLSPAHRAVRMCRGDGTIERRLKISASAAFMLDDDVDKAAEEFIARFYRELRVQRWLDHYC